MREKIDYSKNYIKTEDATEALQVRNKCFPEEKTDENIYKRGYPEINHERIIEKTQENIRGYFQEIKADEYIYEEPKVRDIQESLDGKERITTTPREAMIKRYKQRIANIFNKKK